MVALWDTGASESYISSDSYPNLPKLSKSYPNPIELRLFDGKPSSAGQITHYIDTNMVVSPNLAAIPIRLNITTLCGADLVIGSNWMTKYGSILNFRRNFATLEVARPNSPNHEVLMATSANIHDPRTHPNNVPLGVRIPRTELKVVLSTSEPAPTIDEPSNIPTIQEVLRAALSKIKIPAKELLPQPTLTKEEYAELVTSNPTV